MAKMKRCKAHYRANRALYPLEGYLRNFINANGWDIHGISPKTGYTWRVVVPSSSVTPTIPTAMASIRCFPKALIDDTLLSPPPIEIAAARKKLLQQPSPNLLYLPISRRDALLISVLPFNLTALSLPSQARERRGRKAISPEEFMTSR